MDRSLDGRALPGRRPDPSMRWQWMSLSLVPLLHVAMYLLLRGGQVSPPPVPGEQVERIRLVFSERASPPAAVRPATPPAGAPTAGRAGPAPLRVVGEPPAAAPPVPHTSLPEHWSAAPEPDAADPGTGHFRRDLFGPVNDSPSDRPRHMPRLEMRDRSLAGRWHEKARRIDCGELAAALGAGSATLVGGGHDPAGRRPIGGEASTDTLLQSMKRRGCVR